MMKKTIVAKKKLTPASICSQKKWQGFPIATKTKLRKTLKDTDKDGVPDKYDCQPQNKRKQESFLPEDLDYINNTPKIKVGKFIGEGKCGEVYSVKGNDNLVVKLPRGFVKNGRSSGLRKSLLVNSVGTFEHQQEINGIYNLDTNNQPLFIPSRIVNMGSCGIGRVRGETFAGIVRPRVKPVGISSNDYKLNDNQLEQIRRKLIQLSHKGIYIEDGLQIGVDRTGRVMNFDLGFLTKGTSSKAFRDNNHHWIQFLQKLGKIEEWYDDEEEEIELRKYGTINPSEHY